MLSGVATGDSDGANPTYKHDRSVTGPFTGYRGRTLAEAPNRSTDSNCQLRESILRWLVKRHISCYAIPSAVTSKSQADDESDRTSVQSEPMDVEVYEDDGSVVLFDAGNPLAWVEATTAVSLTDVA